jgi:hypothetical protein
VSSSNRVRWWVRGAVLVPAVLVALLPAGDVAIGAADRATLPEELAGYSYLTASVSRSAPGRAIALYQHGYGVEFMDFPQAVVAGADGEATRRLDVAEDRPSEFGQDEPAPMLLSPDGSRVAVGTYDAAEPDLFVVDLSDGSVAEHSVPVVRSAVPVAWSADGERIAYLGSGRSTDPHSGVPTYGNLGVLDLADGRAEILPAGQGATAAAFSPDGSELAVQRLAGPLQVLDARGESVRRTLSKPHGHALDAPDAWSPDGRLLAVADGNTVAFVDPSGAGAPTPPTLDLSWHRMLGWTAADRIVLLVPEPRGAVDPHRQWITDVPLDGGEPRRLASVPTGGGNYAVDRFQLAGGLLPDAEVTETGFVDRGPWPVWPRLLAAVALALLAARILSRVIVALTTPDDPARRPATPGPPTPPGPAQRLVGSAAG